MDVDSIHRTAVKAIKFSKRVESDPNEQVELTLLKETRDISDIKAALEYLQEKTKQSSKVGDRQEKDTAIFPQQCVQKYFIHVWTSLHKDQRAIFTDKGRIQDKNYHTAADRHAINAFNGFYNFFTILTNKGNAFLLLPGKAKHDSKNKCIAR